MRGHTRQDLFDIRHARFHSSKSILGIRSHTMHYRMQKGNLVLPRNLLCSIAAGLCKPLSKWRISKCCLLICWPAPQEPVVVSCFVIWRGCLAGNIGLGLRVHQKGNDQSVETQDFGENEDQNHADDWKLLAKSACGRASTYKASVVEQCLAHQHHPQYQWQSLRRDRLSRLIDQRLAG